WMASRSSCLPVNGRVAHTGCIVLTLLNSADRRAQLCKTVATAEEIVLVELTSTSAPGYAGAGTCDRARRVSLEPVGQVELGRTKSADSRTIRLPEGQTPELTQFGR